MTRDVKRANRLAAERLDVLEPPAPPKGCNVRLEDGKLCRRLVVDRRAGLFTVERLCRFHARQYAEHRRVLARIRAL